MREKIEELRTGFRDIFSSLKIPVLRYIILSFLFSILFVLVENLSAKAANQMSATIMNAFLSAFVGIAAMINQIYFQRNYWRHRQAESPPEFSTVLQFWFHSTRIYLLYLFFVLLICAVPGVAASLMRPNPIGGSVSFFSSLLVFCVFLAMFFLFYRLIFVDYILIRKRGRYKIREILRESREILGRDKKAYRILYTGQTLVLLAAMIAGYIPKPPGAFWAVTIVNNAVQIFFFLAYLVSFANYRVSFGVLKEENPTGGLPV